MSYLEELKNHYKAVRKRLCQNAVKSVPRVKSLPPHMPKLEPEQRAKSAPNLGLISEKAEKEIVCKALRITDIGSLNHGSQAYKLADELVNSPRLPPLPGLVLNEQGAVRWMRILHAVAKHHGVDAADITGTSQKRHVVNARFELFYRLRIDLAMSYTKIGSICNRDHTTVMHGVKKIRQMLLDEIGRLSDDRNPSLVNHLDQSGTPPVNLSAD